MRSCGFYFNVAAVALLGGTAALAGCSSNATVPSAPALTPSNLTRISNRSHAGRVARIVVAPLPHQPYVETPASPDPGTQTFVLLGDTAQRFVATGVDAAGKPVVPAPSIVVRGYAGDITASTVQSRSGEFAINVDSNTLAGDGAYRGGATVVLVATDSRGDETTAGVDFHFAPAIYVGYGSSRGGRPAIAVYDQRGKTLALPAKAFAGVRAPTALAWDAPDGELLVADASDNRLHAYDALGAPIAGFQSPALKSVSALTYSAALHTFYATDASGVSAIASNGTVSSGGGIGAGATPFGIAAADVACNDAVCLPAPHPAIVVGDAASSTIRAYTASGKQIGAFAGSCARPAIAFASAIDERRVGGAYVACPQTAHGDDLFESLLPERPVYATWSDYRVRNSATATSVAALALDPTTVSLYYLDSSGNAVVRLDRRLGTSPPLRFATPPRLGLHDPRAIAISPTYQ